MHLGYWVLGAAFLMAISAGVESRYLTLDGRCGMMVATIHGAREPSRIIDSPFVWHNPYRDKFTAKRTELSAAELRSRRQRAELCEAVTGQCPVSAQTVERCRVLQSAAPGGAS